VKHYLFAYLPYLPLDERLEIGDWQLIPADSLSVDDVAPSTALGLAQGLVQLYQRPPSFPARGAFARMSAEKVGDEFGLDEFGRLRRAVLVTLLDRNPSGVESEDERDGNEAWKTYTSEHAQVWGHPIDEEGWSAEERGRMVTTLAGGYNVLDEDSIRFAFPAELHSPRTARLLDLEYGSALYKLLCDESPEARRLARTIDWLDLVWRNSDALDLNLRIAALHSGFETLLDAPANAGEAARALSLLLDPADVAKSIRPEWRTRSGKQIDEEISDLGWWFVQFAQLRNAILHGDEITSADHHDDLERAHLWVGEWTLRAAIKETVAASGWPDLRFDPLKRKLERALRKAGLDGPESN
jgi:hypothetical protein